MGRNLRVQKSVGGGDPAAAADPQHRPEPLMVGGGVVVRYVVHRGTKNARAVENRV